MNDFPTSIHAVSTLATEVIGDGVIDAAIGFSRCHFHVVLCAIFQ